MKWNFVSYPGPESLYFFAQSKFLTKLNLRLKLASNAKRLIVQLDQKRNSKSDRVATCSSSFGNVLVRVLSSARVLLFSPSNLEN